MNRANIGLWLFCFCCQPRHFSWAADAFHAHKMNAPKMLQWEKIFMFYRPDNCRNRHQHDRAIYKLYTRSAFAVNYGISLTVATFHIEPYAGGIVGYGRGSIYGLNKSHINNRELSNLDFYGLNGDVKFDNENVCKRQID